MDVRQLRYFAEVVEAKSFTKAAERVRVAQPALGFQVRKLEDELGIPLLVRHSRGVAPTEAGRALLKHARAILRQVESARQEMIDLAGPPRGPVALGITPTASALMAVRIVEDCARAWPGISLNLVEGLSEEVMRWLDEGRVDLGFTYNPQAAKGIRTLPLLVEDLFLVAAAKAGGAGRDRIPFARLAGRKLILPSRPHGTRMLLEQAAAARGADLDVACEVDSVATMRELVEAGAGATVLPFGAVRDAVRDGRLRALRIERPRISRTLHIAHAPNGARSNAAQAVHAMIWRLAADRIRAGGGFRRAPEAP